MLTIRLSKVGKKNKKMFRLVISEKTKDPVGDSLEILGSYNPHSKELQAKADRIKYWIAQGAGMSATVNNLLIEKKIIEGKKAKSSGLSKKRQARIAKKKEDEIKAKADAEAKAAKEAEEKSAAETPAAPVETPAETANAETPAAPEIKA
jgi:small subunit ribosomal protein S16